ncbi:methionine ABC transporter substrate-binding protein [Enterococcus sp. JM4C]|uniref:MetQ/NlpA family ABC transporter substrate-binding protein n=1 Tax=Candidatus Enterococcus huntleyi TaxID=1857217 RepID=UPI00137B85EE|nr:MetQ/NlpA family ABC transporter substrate-binding protein [Enterococcus sp. JM4C]KAF1299340.1 methionine ABC transporter substrate-binding protein [Enterococcus sp. JM4C]
MKKKIFGFAAVLLVAVGLTACGNGKSDTASSGSDKDAEKTVLKVGASPSPHGEILEQVKPILEKEGIELEIVPFDDYVLPNKALSDGDIDANYFQHLPFFNKAIEDNGYDFANIGAVHLEPMGLYSKKIKDIKDLKDGATVIVSSSVSDWGRVISILQAAELVKVKDGVDLETATFDDIAENPKNLKFENTIAPELLATTYNNEEGDLVAINANFAYGIELNPLEDALLLEGDDSPYVNILATRTEDKDKDAIKKLIAALHEPEVQSWIVDKWGGSVKPVDK